MTTSRRKNEPRALRGTAAPRRRAPAVVQAVVEVVEVVEEDRPMHAQHLSLDALCAVGYVSASWITERVEAGLIPAAPGEPGAWRFEAHVLRRVSTMRSIERDFDANPELAALVADLRDEIESLRLQLGRVRLRRRE